MTKRWESQLKYLFRTKSDRFIAVQTGIPRSTLGFVRRGERALPSVYVSEIRNTFQRTVYAEMKSYGFSASQAKRFTWYAPESINVRLTDYRLRVEEMSLGVMTKRIARMQDAGIAYNEDSVYQEAFADVQEGLRQSKAPVEDILDGSY